MEKTFRITFPISKAEEMPDGRLYVSGIATSDAIDKQNERLLFDGSVKALSEWLDTGPAVREQHDPLKAVGSGLEMEPIPETGQIRVGVFVSAAEKGTQTKVRENVLRAFSIGGKPTAWDMVKRGDKKVREISAWQMEELSLVDRPANPDCRIDFVKNSRLVDDRGEGDEMTQKAEDPEKKPDETKPPEGEAPPPQEGDTAPPPKEGEEPPPKEDEAPPPPEGEEEATPATPPAKDDDAPGIKIDKGQMAEIVTAVTDAVLAAIKAQTEAVAGDAAKSVAAMFRKNAATAAWDIRLALDTLDMLEALKSYEGMEPNEPADQMPKLTAACTALREFIASEAKELLEEGAAVTASARKIDLIKSAGKADARYDALASELATLAKAVGSLKADNGEAEAIRKTEEQLAEVRKGIAQILKMPVPGNAPLRFFDPRAAADQNLNSAGSREAMLEELMAKADVTVRPFIERELNFLRVGRANT